MKLTWGDARVELRRLFPPHLRDCCWITVLELLGLDICSFFWKRCCPLFGTCCGHAVVILPGVSWSYWRCAFLALCQHPMEVASHLHVTSVLIWTYPGMCVYRVCFSTIPTHFSKSKWTLLCPTYLIQYWHWLRIVSDPAAEGSVPQDCPHFTCLLPSPGCHLCFSLTGCKSEVPTTPSWVQLIYYN